MPEPMAETYRPLSGFAVAGFAAGVVFAGIVFISAVLALVQGIPVFFPMWVLSVAAAGVVLSLLGQREIRNSEGTRAGEALARAGFWLCIVAGLGYLSYYYVTGLALTSQAHQFLTDDST